MKTPICDFVREYAACDPMRLHMPGHKGNGAFGVEQWDITEIEGADNLYQPVGIIQESEANASALFGCHTVYSTEGSSQCIRAMLYLATVYGPKRSARVAAVRNVHKAFLDAAALLDLDVEWLYPTHGESYVSCRFTAEELDAALRAMPEPPAAVYVTSPDYLGHMADVRALSQVCHRYGTLLLVDNAHGAYLKFLSPSRHPMDLGADLCCDSAHKTLPVLTGGAYLHIAHDCTSTMAAHAKEAMALFGSTSPSYLILQSLDRANAYIEDGYRERLATFVTQTAQLKERLSQVGYAVQDSEPLKLVLRTKPYGYSGTAFSQALQQQGAVCEFADPDYVVCMLSPDMTDLSQVERILCAVPRKAPIAEAPLPFHRCERVLAVRQAMLSVSETIAVSDAVGRVCAAPAVTCPPAVPIVIAGERIDEAAAACFAYYGIPTCCVVK